MDGGRCTVVVVNFNGREFISECLESLRRQDVTNFDVEIVVVDNDSSDGSAELVEQQFSEIQVIRSETNLGFAGGVNLAIAETTGDLVVLVNNDATAEPGFLQAITAPFRSDDDNALAAVTGRIVLTGRFVPAPGNPDAYVSATGDRWVRVADGAPDGSGVELLNSTGSQLSRSGNGRDRSWLSPVDSPTPSTDVFGFCGGAVALSREAVEFVGRFDDGLFMYYEDLDLSWRLRRCGFHIRYAPDAVVRHRHAASSGIRSRFFLVHNIRNRVLVTARNAPPAMLRAALIRTAGNLAKTLLRSLSPTTGADARRQLSSGISAVGQLVRKLPAYRTDGRRRDGRSTFAREFIYDWTVED